MNPNKPIWMIDNMLMLLKQFSADYNNPDESDEDKAWTAKKVGYTVHNSSSPENREEADNAHT